MVYGILFNIKRCTIHAILVCIVHFFFGYMKNICNLAFLITLPATLKKHIRLKINE
jgi:hypothetical protein